VTIESDMGIGHFNQIQGKGNAAPLPKYMQYLFEWKGEEAEPSDGSKRYKMSGKYYLEDGTKESYYEIRAEYIPRYEWEAVREEERRLDKIVESFLREDEAKQWADQLGKKQLYRLTWYKRDGRDETSYYMVDPNDPAKSPMKDRNLDGWRIRPSYQRDRFGAYGLFLHPIDDEDDNLIGPIDAYDSQIFDNTEVFEKAIQALKNLGARFDEEDRDRWLTSLYEYEHDI
jgi:hypothetical protein